MSDRSSVHLQGCLDRLRAGDESARKDLLNGACERLEQLTRVMLRDYRRLKRWEQTEDVRQNALVRLYRALEQVTPPTLRDFYRLAALQIRRELIDLARHHYGPEGPGGKHESVADPDGATQAETPAPEPTDLTHHPGRLAVWGEFHAQIDALPDEEREVFDLVWYQGLTHTEAAALLDVSTKTVQRRWHGACRRLYEALHGEMPEL
jgi:RNA polymerase sigma-70 factor (ECF subfamily)